MEARDIVVVMDYSGSMNYDSTFQSMAKLGQAEIESNLNKVWDDLGNPVYGNMGFTPEYLEFGGVPASGNIPHIDITWKGTEIDVVSTKNLSKVKLKFDDGNTKTF